MDVLVGTYKQQQTHAHSPAISTCQLWVSENTQTADLNTTAITSQCICVLPALGSCCCASGRGISSCEESKANKQSRTHTYTHLWECKPPNHKSDRPEDTPTTDRDKQITAMAVTNSGKRSAKTYCVL